MNFLFAIALLIASYVISSLVNKPKRAEPAKPALESEFDFPQADEGTPQAVIFGDCWSSNWVVLWHGNDRSVAIKSGGGGKK